MSLTIQAQHIEITDGGALDTGKIKVQDIAAVQGATASLNLGIKVKAANDGAISLYENNLTMETPIETKRYGTLTLRQVLEHPDFLNKPHMRCQAPFRASESEAAFVSLDSQGNPFVFDSGSGIKYLLADGVTTPEAAITPLVDINQIKASRYLDTPAPAPRWLVQGVISQGIVGTIVAPGGTGKTMMALQLGISVASGERFAGVWDIGSPGAALLLLGEDDDAELHRRMETIKRHLPNVEKSAWDRLLVKSMVGEDMRLTSTDKSTWKIEPTHTHERLMSAAMQIPNLRLIVLDSLTRWRGEGDENDASTASRFIQICEQLAQKTGATVLVLHHTAKSVLNSEEPSQAAGRGSSAFVNDSRLMIQLMPINTAMNKTYKLPDDEKTWHVVLAVPKANGAPPQPTLLLRRHEGGYLSLADTTTRRLTEPTKVDTEIIKKIRAAAVAGTPYSKRSFSREFGGKGKPFHMGEKALAEMITNLIAVGHLKREGTKLS